MVATRTCTTSAICIVLDAVHHHALRHIIINIAAIRRDSPASTSRGLLKHFPSVRRVTVTCCNDSSPDDGGSDEDDEDACHGFAVAASGWACCCCCFRGGGGGLEPSTDREIPTYACSRPDNRSFVVALLLADCASARPVPLTSTAAGTADDADIVAVERELSSVRVEGVPALLASCSIAVASATTPVPQRGLSCKLLPLLRVPS